jgi:hypothetical protein
MELDGYKIRAALKRWDDARTLASQTFADSLYAFDGEEKRNPEEVAEQFQVADVFYASLQIIQAVYNQRMKVDFLSKKISLAVAVKMIGGAGRVEKMWKDAVTGRKRDIYDDREQRRRDADTEYAKKTISQARAMEKANEASKLANQLRNGIARANTHAMIWGEAEANEHGITAEQLAELFA